MSKKLLIIFIFFGCIPYIAQAQLGMSADACPSEILTLVNPESNPINQWDFCNGDLSQTPTATLVTDDIPNAARPEGGTIVTDGTNWYMFIVNRNTNSIIRTDFGDDLDNIPTYTDLGNISSVLSSPLDINVIKDNGNWYAVVSNLNNQLVRINFGANLNNNSPTANAFTVTGLNLPLWLDLEKDGNDFIAIVADNNFAGNNGIVMIRFQNGMSNNSPSLITTPAINGNLLGVDVIKDGSNWYGIAVSIDNKIYHLNYGTSLYSVPTVTDITGNISGTLAGPNDVEIVKDGKNYIALIQSPSPQVLFKLDFGTTMANQSPTYTSYGNVDNRFAIANTFLTVGKDKSKWKVFVINRNTVTGQKNSLVRVDFPSTCNASQAISTETTPKGVSYVLPATYTVSLDTYDNDRNLISTYSQDITIKSATVGNFTFNNQCFGQTTTFTNTSVGSDSNVASWNWDFGDGNTSTLKTPTHKYNASGTYTAKLTVNNISGCVNTYTQQIDIVNMSANFEVLSGGCPNSATQYKSTSIISPTSLPVTYRWLLKNGDELSFLQQPSFTYTEGTYTVSLSVIVGTTASSCVSSITKSIPIVNPPKADFSFTEAFVGQAVQFIDQSTVTGGATISDWEWGFAGTATSKEQNPKYTFAKEGEFTVALRVKTNAGCQSEFIIKTVQVKPIPQQVITTIEAPEEILNTLIIKNLYPNPTTDFINIEYSTPSSKIPITLYLIDGQGKIAEEQTFNIENAGTQTLQKQFSKKYKGTYFIRLQQGMMQSSKKILIQ